MNFKLYTRQLNPFGKIAYEYNPFKNFRKPEQATHVQKKDKDDKTIYTQPEGDESPEYVQDGDSFRKALPLGAISDLITDKLNFDLEHPVHIECQSSYDGSVNLILNDGLNPTRIINSRFSNRQNNTYEIVDRTGNSDTNIYDQSQFDIDTSLRKKINTIPKLNFIGLTYGGNLPVGSYNFYFKYCDADGNETDFVAESGNVVCHIGNINDPYSIRGGLENENSGKIVQFSITNLDKGYEYIKVFYSRQTSSAHNEPVTEYKQIIKKFKCKGGVCIINITGFEETLPSTLVEINKEYFTFNSAKSAAQCKNRLFLANLKKSTLNYQDFTDVSIKIYPTLECTDIEYLNKDYKSDTSNYLYYDANNIYNNVGYWNEEIYRLGIVYVMSDDSLSPVFNIRGINELNENTDWDGVNFSLYNGDKRIYQEYDEETGLVQQNKYNLENAKGVIRINKDSDQIFGIKVNITSKIIKYLKNNLKVKGFFFVRQKRIPNILAQALVIGHDITSGLPLIPYKQNGTISYKHESFTDAYGILSEPYGSRLCTIPSENVNNEIAICPDYSVRQEMYNNFFTDTDFVVKEVKKYDTLTQDSDNSRHYYIDTTNTTSNTNIWRNTSIIGVPEGIPVKRTEKALFCSKAGIAESYDFKTVGTEFDLDYSVDNDNKQKIARGIYGPYLGLSGYKGDVLGLINIYIPNYQESKMQDYFSIRMEDQSPYYAISDRIDLSDITTDYTTTLYRGDCYICQYTHRLNRNFCDLNAPTNDIIVDNLNWRTNYRPDTEPEKLGNINIGDLNAVRLGNWITFTVRSNMNLSMRDMDSSYVSESLLMGNNRSFYPLSEMSVDGNYKIPEASIINTGISSQTSARTNFTQPEVPYLKNSYQTRIAYSDIAVTDAFKNGYRTFQAQSYRDYPTNYGGIMKILEVKNSLLVIFEHGIGLAPINERVVAGSGTGGDVFINTNNVLPETLNMITTDYGSQWPDSVLQTPHGVYGIDTVAKKIWKYSGNQIEIISDSRVQKFLNDNITLTETELTPIIGIRNVKTHYNAFKKDVMFTFYDCLKGYEEKAWNLCWNETIGRFVTFYSWIPSFSANIDNICFTFDRDTSKKIAKLDNTKKGEIKVNTYDLASEDITLTLDVTIPQTYKIEWSLESTIFKADKQFSLEGNKLQFNKSEDGFLNKHNIIPLNVKAVVYEGEKNDNIIWGVYKKQLYFTTSGYLNTLTTHFWKHGYGGIIDSQDTIKPCMWYNRQHPFEFEYVVNVNPDQQKTFDNLEILSNNVAPESFHYEIVGDTYDFSQDKLNMYVRQEKTKHLYQLNGSDITYNPNYITLSNEVRQRPIYSEFVYYDKSTLFPTYYFRQDTFDEIYDDYVTATDPYASRNYSQLAGGEIKYDSILNQFSIVNHVKAVDMRNSTQGRLRGNIQYIDDRWLAQINPLNFVQKNEQWNNNEIPLNLRYTSLLNDIHIINTDNLPTTTTDVVNKDWGKRKEAKLKDKYMKVKIRYEGNKLALILGVRTTFRV